MHSPGMPCTKFTFSKKVRATATVGVEVQHGMMVQDYPTMRDMTNPGGMEPQDSANRN